MCSENLHECISCVKRKEIQRKACKKFYSKNKDYFKEYYRKNKVNKDEPVKEYKKLTPEEKKAQRKEYNRQYYLKKKSLKKTSSK